MTIVDIGYVNRKENSKKKDVSNNKEPSLSDLFCDKKSIPKRKNKTNALSLAEQIVDEQNIEAIRKEHCINIMLNIFYELKEYSDRIFKNKTLSRIEYHIYISTTIAYYQSIKACLITEDNILYLENKNILKKINKAIRKEPEQFAYALRDIRSACNDFIDKYSDDYDYVD